MSLSAEQISEINRRNAARSTGPKTTAGKARASMNSCIHGLRSEKLTLPNEPADWVDALAGEWESYYQPQSPGRRALVDRAVLATVHHKRSRRYLTGILDTQVRGAVHAFNVQQEDVVRHYMELLKSDPGAAARGLNRSAAGCRQLVSEWLGLLADLDTDGHWIQSRREHATRLMGRRPEDPNDEGAFWLRYYNVAAREPQNEAAMAAVIGPGSLPDTLYWVRGTTHPTPQESQEKLRVTVTTELAAVRAQEERLRIHIEEPDRAAAVEKAMLLAPEEMARWLRYERMHDSMFHRAYNALERPEAARPDAGPIPDADSRREETAACSPGSGSEVERAVTPSTNNVSASERPAGPAEAVVERQTKRMVTDEPVAPAVSAEEATVAMPLEEPGLTTMETAATPWTAEADYPIPPCETVRVDDGSHHAGPVRLPPEAMAVS
jgi:hypothetical protein